MAVGLCGVHSTESPAFFGWDVKDKFETNLKFIYLFIYLYGNLFCNASSHVLFSDLILGHKGVDLDW